MRLRPVTSPASIIHSGVNQMSKTLKAHHDRVLFHQRLELAAMIMVLAGTGTVFVGFGVISAVIGA